MGTLPVAHLPAVEYEATCPEGSGCTAGTIYVWHDRYPVLAVCAWPFPFSLAGCYAVLYPVDGGVDGNARLLLPVEGVAHVGGDELNVSGVAAAGAAAFSAGAVLALSRRWYEVPEPSIGPLKAYLCCGRYGEGVAEHPPTVAMLRVPLLVRGDTVVVPDESLLPLKAYIAKPGPVGGYTVSYVDHIDSPVERLREKPEQGETLILVGDNIAFVSAPFEGDYIRPGVTVDINCRYDGCQVTGCDLRGWSLA